MKLDIETQKIIIATLQQICAERDKRRDILVSNGVDLSKFENGYYDSLIEIILHIIGEKHRKILNWWIWETECRIFADSELFIHVDLTTPEKFVNYLCENSEI